MGGILEPDTMVQPKINRNGLFNDSVITSMNARSFERRGLTLYKIADNKNMIDVAKYILFIVYAISSPEAANARYSMPTTVADRFNATAGLKSFNGW
jgi:hypothetical protein